MNASPLLIELLTEELPPKALKRLGNAFAEGIVAELRRLDFVSEQTTFTPFMTPRRLAVRIDHVVERQPEQVLERKGPAVAAAYDADGRPSKALEGFLRSTGVAPDRLTTTPDGRYVMVSLLKTGEALVDFLPAIVENVAKRLPIPKLMHWGDSDDLFVRPVHGLMLLYGETLLPGTVFGRTSRRETRGHRFLGVGDVAITSAETYETQLETLGSVIASFARRRRMIETGLLEAAGHINGARPVLDAALLDEVAGLVEYPAVYAGRFDDVFLAVPQECLMLSMTQHQKYFPLVDENGKLLPRFLIVSNMPIADPANIIAGNERVLRARLSDARFFYEQDIKTKLVDRLPALAQVVYHNRLGTQLERVERLRRLAGLVAARLGSTPETLAMADRAAMLCKADLVTDMVGEFPELQGVMGRYYALNDKEPDEVAEAIEQHYWPRFSGDRLPETDVAVSCALADRLDGLAGIFGIGLTPTGDKDPFGLRRHALAVLRTLIDRKISVSLKVLLEDAAAGFPAGLLDASTTDRVYGFMIDRLKFDCLDRGFAPDVVESVLAETPDRIDVVVPKMAAVAEFSAMPEAETLAAANKRIVNILRKNPSDQLDPDESLLAEPAEIALYQAVVELSSPVGLSIDHHQFTEALTRLAVLKPPIDAFFDSVMVVADDAAVRNNRLALLKRLARLTNGVADLSKLTVKSAQAI